MVSSSICKKRDIAVGPRLKTQLARLRRIGCMAAVLLAGSAVSAAAQAIPEVFTTVDGGSATITLSGLSTTTTSDAVISLNFLGDLDGSAAAFPENLTVSLDGTSIGMIGNTGTGTGCTPQTATLTVPQATFAPLITDGQLVISYNANPNVSNQCAAALSGGAGADRAFTISGTLTFTGSPVVPGGAAASDTNAQFMANRARSLIQNQPDVVRFVDGRNTGVFAVDATRNQGSIDLQSVVVGPLWGSLSGSYSDSDGSDQKYFLGAFGAHAVVGRNAIVGAMVEFDYAEEDLSDGTETSGSGWLVGPYFAAQLGNQPLFVDGRLLYGQTDNETQDAAGVRGDFNGDRLLASLGLEGRMNMPGYALFPSVEVTYVRDSQDAYSDSAATLVIGQEVSQTDVALGLSFEKPLGEISNGFTLTGGAAAIWSETDRDIGGVSSIRFDDGWRGRLDVGYRYDTGKGFSSRANLFTDGIGGGSSESYGVEFRANFRF